MAIGPLEYIALALDRDQLTDEVLPELAAIQAQGVIRDVDPYSSKKTTAARSPCKR